MTGVEEGFFGSLIETVTESAETLWTRASVMRDELAISTRSSIGTYEEEGRTRDDVDVVSREPFLRAMRIDVNIASPSHARARGLTSAYSEIFSE